MANESAVSVLVTNRLVMHEGFTGNDVECNLAPSFVIILN